MNRIKQFIYSNLLVFYFDGILNEHWLLPAIYLINFINFDFRLTCVFLLCGIVHKLYNDMYITDRYVSMTILFATIFMKFFHLNVIYLLLFYVIIKDTMLYQKKLTIRQINKDYINFLQNFSQNSIQQYEQHNETNFLLCDNDDDTEFYNL